MDNKGNIRECGPRIKAAREYRNMTVQEIADKCAIDPKLFETAYQSVKMTAKMLKLNALVSRLYLIMKFLIIQILWKALTE